MALQLGVPLSWRTVRDVLACTERYVEPVPSTSQGLEVWDQGTDAVMAWVHSGGWAAQPPALPSFTPVASIF